MRRIIALLLTLSIISCNTDNSNYKLEGKALGFAEGTKIFVFTVADNNQPISLDTLTVTNESFEGTYPKSENLSINYLQVENLKGNILFFPENTDLKATIYKDSLQSSFVTGSQQNDSYKLFNEKIIYFNIEKSKSIEAYKTARREQDNLLAADLKKQSAEIVESEKKL